MVGNGLGFLYSCCLSASKQDAPVVWPRPDQVYHVGQLVHALATVVGMHVHILRAKVAPLKAIDRTQIPLLPMLEPNAV